MLSPRSFDIRWRTAPGLPAALLGLAALAPVEARSGSALPENGPPRRYQNSPVFAISLERVDPDAQEVALEVYDRTSREWRAAGKFLLGREGARTVEGSATFRATGEGEYPLRARARDGAGNLDPKGPGADSADIVAVYDATPPVVEIVSPGRPQTVPPGGEVAISWRTREANPLREGAASVEMSIDGGRSWRALASQIDDSGTFSFSVGDREGEVLVRVAVRDLCGNRGEGLAPAISVRAPPGAARIAKEASADSGSEKPRPDRSSLARERHREGASALAAGDFARAERALREAVAADPGLEAAWLDLSCALAGAGRLGKARVVLERAARMWPSSAAFQYNLGLVLVRSGRLEEARAALERASQLDPDCYEARWVLALLALDSGNLELAREHWREVVRAASESSPMRGRALEYLAASETKRARPGDASPGGTSTGP